MAVHEDGTVLAFGTPGGDQQDQWSFEFFLAHAVFGLGLQAAIDAPMFHTDSFPSSFYPRETLPRSVEIEGRAPAGTIAALRARGHDVTVVDDWSLGRLSRDLARAGRPAARRREPARDAGVRRRALDRLNASTCDRWSVAGAGWYRTVTGSVPVAHDRSPGGSRR